MTKYPNAKEENWPIGATLSYGSLEVEAGILGDIISDGLRGYICTVCGKVITEAHHIKPERYKVIYMGQEFYMERHVCDPCMKSGGKTSEDAMDKMVEDGICLSLGSVHEEDKGGATPSSLPLTPRCVKIRGLSVDKDIKAIQRTCSECGRVGKPDCPFTKWEDEEANL